MPRKTTKPAASETQVTATPAPEAETKPVKAARPRAQRVAAPVGAVAQRADRVRRPSGPPEIVLPAYVETPLLRILGTERPGIDRIPANVGSAITRTTTEEVARPAPIGDGEFGTARVEQRVTRTLRIAQGVVSLMVMTGGERGPTEGTYSHYAIGSHDTTIDSDAGDRTFPRTFPTRPAVTGHETSSFQAAMGHELTALADTLEAERAASASGLAETAQARSVVVFPEWVTITPAGR